MPEPVGLRAQATQLEEEAGARKAISAVPAVAL